MCRICNEFPQMKNRMKKSNPVYYSQLLSTRDRKVTANNVNDLIDERTHKTDLRCNSNRCLQMQSENIIYEDFGNVMTFCNFRKAVLESFGYSMTTNFYHKF